MDIRTPIPSNGGDLLAKWGDLWKTQVAALQQKFGADIEAVKMPPDAATDLPIVYVKKEAIVAVLKFMKTDPEFDYDFLSDLTATDEEAEYRFELVYHLRSLSKKARIRIKVRVKENESVPTLISVWPGANWAEREVYDMFGVKFDGHPDLRRILMDLRWEGHPLRKDYPLRGYQIFTEPEAIDPSLLD